MLQNVDLLYFSKYYATTEFQALSDSTSRGKQMHKKNIAYGKARDSSIVLTLSEQKEDFPKGIKRKELVYCVLYTISFSVYCKKVFT